MSAAAVARLLIRNSAAVDLAFCRRAVAWW
jgi:hypothetical protein